MRKDIIAIATKEIGTKESPANSNLTKYGEWFGLNGVAWCGIFCSWVYAMAGHPLGVIDYLKGFAGIPFALKHWANQKTQNPLQGDLVIYDWNKDGSPDHVGIFLEWIDQQAGLFYAIEGNTSPSNQSNGGEVMKRMRNKATVSAFINPLNLPA